AEAPSRKKREDETQVAENIGGGETLGGVVVKLKAKGAAEGLIEFARREGITHVIFGQTARSRWEILLKGSVLNRFLAEVRNAAVQIIPPGDMPEQPPSAEGRAS